MQSEIAGHNKKLKIIHTADWHLGQKFYDYERVSEHECFLSWLKDIIEEREIDILLISGDIFDTSSPSTTAQEMFYNFLFRLTKIPHKVYVVIIAGNHDSAARLEAPSQLMKILNINVIGSLKKKSGDIDYKSAIVNIKSEEGDKECFIAAIPFLRQGDYPLIKDVENPYSSGIVEVYAQTYKNIIEEIKINSHSLDIPVIAMGHMHCSTASLSDSERGIRGGLEVIDNNLLEIGYDYIALGHINKSQKIEDKDYIRYSGSPIPMSFSEINYKHKIIEIEFENQERKITEIIIHSKVNS